MELAVYRQIQVSFWQDGFVLDLTPEEKYFYIYLMTNSKTTQCGIYELPKKIIETETGYNRETVDKLLNRFVDYKKIKYCEETKEVFLVNWVKYNSINSPKVKSCIEKELQDIKHKEFVKEFYSLSMHYGYSIDTLSKDYGEEQQQEEQQQKEKEKEKQQDEVGVDECCRNDSIKKVMEYYCKVSGIFETKIKPKDISTAEKLIGDNIPVDMIIKGIDNAFSNFKSQFEGDKINSLSYCEPVIKSLWAIEKEAQNGTSNRNNKSDNGDGKVKYSFAKYGG